MDCTEIAEESCSCLVKWINRIASAVSTTIFALFLKVTGQHAFNSSPRSFFLLEDGDLEITDFSAF
jgi:hypothetical protein